jgi:hypothetical protein
MRPSRASSESSSSLAVSDARRPQFLEQLLARLKAALAHRDPYRGVALGVESAWPATLQVQRSGQATVFTPR